MVHEELSKKTVDSRDAEYRKNNLIVYRVPEKKTEDVSERKNNDMSFVKDLLDAIFNMKLYDGDIEKMYRLGQWAEDRARPLLIRFKDCEKKQQIMTNVRNLKQQQIAKFQGISMSNDLPPKEREEIKQMLDQAKKDHVGDGSAAAENYWFKVVGHGQKKRVIKIRKHLSDS